MGEAEEEGDGSGGAVLECNLAGYGGLVPSCTCGTRSGRQGLPRVLENGGTIENAQAIAAHESPRMMKLCDRTGDEVTLDEVEQIEIRVRDAGRPRPSRFAPRGIAS